MACGPVKGCATPPPAAQGQFLYVVHDPEEYSIAPGADPQIAAMQIDPGTGGLAMVPGGSAAPKAVGAFALAHDASGRWFSLTGGQMGLLRLKADGRLEPLAGRDQGGLAAAFDPAGRYFFVATGHAIRVHAFDPDSGVATRVAHLQPAPFFANLSLTPDGRFLIGAGDRSLGIYTVDADTGRLTPAAASPVALPVRAIDLLVHPSGRLLFVRGDYGAAKRVAVYHLSADGTARQLADSPVDLGAEIGDVALSADGRFLFVVDSDRDAISSFGIDAEGGLHLVARTDLPEADKVGALAVDAGSRYLYLAVSTPGRVLGWQIQDSGDLTPIQGSPFAVARKIGLLATTPGQITLAELPDADSFGEPPPTGPRFDPTAPIPADTPIGELATHLQDPSESTRYAAILALGRRTDIAPALPALIAALDDDHAGVAVRAGLILGPWALDHPGTLDDEVLGRILNGKHGRGAGSDNGVLCALYALQRRGAPAAPHLARALVRPSDQIRDEALSTLLAMGRDGKAAVPDLIALLQNPRADQHAALILGGIGPDAADAVPVLYGLLRHRSPAVARAAQDAIARIRGAAP
jgi:6-phosphogluconolactonase (cycloisomerase 2 family)